MFIWKNKGDFKYLEIDSFSKKGINAFFTSRKGGVSDGVFNSLNLGLHTSDKKNKVIMNRKILAKNLNIEFASLTSAKQVHSNNIYIVKDGDRGKGRLEYENSIENTDALITTSKDITLFSYYADCVPLYFYDLENKIIGLAHSGWKGTLKKISLKVLEKLKERFATDLNNCLVAIGPSISKEYYEVDERIINKFEEEFDYLDEFIVHKGKDRYLLDLPGLNKSMLIKAGILSKNIDLSNICTFSDKENFYSYRRDKGKTGRMASIITF